MVYCCPLSYRAGVALDGRLRRMRLQLLSLPTETGRPTLSSAPKTTRVAVQTQEVEEEVEKEEAVTVKQKAEAASVRQKVEEKVQEKKVAEKREVEKEAATQGGMDSYT
jgi:hypothetical protein